MSQPAAVQRAIQQRIDARNIQTLLGICAGLIADQQINDQEIHFLKTWLMQHESIINDWPASAIYFRINSILADGVITEDERVSLVELLTELSGNAFLETGSASADTPALPIDDDPSVFFRNMNFCFTGEFLHGTKAACERTIQKLGAFAQDRVNKKLHYLVIGSRVSPNWKNSTYGTKIEYAMQLKQSGTELLIISEQQWDSALKDAHR